MISISPVVIGQEAEYIQDRLAVHQRATQTQTGHTVQPHTHTIPKGNLE